MQQVNGNANGEEINQDSHARHRKPQHCRSKYRSCESYRLKRTAARETAEAEATRKRPLLGFEEGRTITTRASRRRLEAPTSTRRRPATSFVSGRECTRGDSHRVFLGLCFAELVNAVNCRRRTVDEHPPLVNRRGGREMRHIGAHRPGWVPRQFVVQADVQTKLEFRTSAINSSGLPSPFLRELADSPKCVNLHPSLSATLSEKWLRGTARRAAPAGSQLHRKIQTSQRPSAFSSGRHGGPGCLKISALRRHFESHVPQQSR